MRKRREKRIVISKTKPAVTIAVGVVEYEPQELWNRDVQDKCGGYLCGRAVFLLENAKN